jgi:hypothetical protein
MKTRLKLVEDFQDEEYFEDEYVDEEYYPTWSEFVDKFGMGFHDYFDDPEKLISNLEINIPQLAKFTEDESFDEIDGFKLYSGGRRRYQVTEDDLNTFEVDVNDQYSFGRVEIQFSLVYGTDEYFNENYIVIPFKFRDGDVIDWEKPRYEGRGL